MNARIIFGLVVLATAGVIYAVDYSKKQERARMRQSVTLYLREERRLEKLKLRKET